MFSCSIRAASQRIHHIGFGFATRSTVLLILLMIKAASACVRQYGGPDDTIKTLLMRKRIPVLNSLECKGSPQRALMECTCDA